MNTWSAVCLMIAVGIGMFVIGRLHGQQEGFQTGIGFMMNIMNGIEIRQGDSEQEEEEG